MNPNEQQSMLAELKAIRRIHTYIALMLLGGVVYFAKDIIMPVVLGILIALTLSPIIRLLSRFSIPAGISAIVVVLSISAILATAILTLSDPVGELFRSVPSIGESLKEKLTPYRSTMNDISEASDQMKELADVGSDDAVQQVVVERPGLLTTAASTLASGVSSLFIALLLSLFILSSGTLFYEKIVTLMPLLSEKKRALRIIYDVEKSVSRYLLTITLINIGLGITIATLLHAFGTPNAILWGAIATVLNFLPFLGALIGASLLAVVSLGISSSLGLALIPPAIYLTCTTMEGNAITPLIVGKRLSLNVVAVFLTVALWGWLWGLAGALMAVPILVVVNVLCDHVERWSALGHFLSGRVTAPKSD